MRSSPPSSSSSPPSRRWSSGFTGKWAATIASIWIQCSSGSMYAFGIYSPLLKSSQGYDQSTLDSVAFFKDVGANVGVLSGLLYSAASGPSSMVPCLRGGPWVVLAVGAVQCFVGYFLMWLSVVGALPRPPVPLMCFYMLLAAHAQTFFNTADVVTAVENFPDHRGTVVGIMKGFLGLSGAILIRIYQTGFEGKPSSFLLMLALLPTIVPFCLMCFVRVKSTVEEHEKRHLDKFSLISLVTAAYLMVIIIVENLQPLGLCTRIVTFSILILILVSPVSVVVNVQLKESCTIPRSGVAALLENANKKEPAEGSGSSEKLGPIYDHIAYHELPSNLDQEQSYDNKKTASRGDNFNLIQAVRTCDFWLLFVAMVCTMGSGLATVNNISQIGGSLGYTSTEMSTLVSLWSIWNFLGRFGGEYLSDYFLHLKGYPRPLFMAAASATMSVGHAVIAFDLPGALYAGSVLVGVCYGTQWSLMPTIASEIFGIRHMGTIFNTIAIASPIGSYIFSVRVIGYLYDMEASSSSGKTCTGAHCFMLSFLIMASVSLVGFFIALCLYFRTRRFYEQVIFSRLRQCNAVPVGRDDVIE